MSTKVVNYKHEPFDVLITRPSCWSNPYIIGVHGSRRHVIVMYERLIRADPAFVQKIKDELRGKRLGCVCKPKECHGDVLARIADEE